MCTATQKPQDNRLHFSASRICLVRARQICNCPRGALICLGSFAQVHQLRCLTSRVSHTGLIRHRPSMWLQIILRYVSTVSEWKCRASLAALGRRNFLHKTSFQHENRFLHFQVLRAGSIPRKTTLPGDRTEDLAARNVETNFPIEIYYISMGKWVSTFQGLNCRNQFSH